jgi:hypothetical protein
MDSRLRGNDSWVVLSFPRRWESRSPTILKLDKVKLTALGVKEEKKMEKIWNEKKEQQWAKTALMVGAGILIAGGLIKALIMNMKRDHVIPLPPPKGDKDG